MNLERIRRIVWGLSELGLMFSGFVMFATALFSKVNPFGIYPHINILAMGLGLMCLGLVMRNNELLKRVKKAEETA